MARKNTIEIVIKGKDQASPVLNNLTSEIKGFAKLAIGALGFGAVALGARNVARAITDMTKSAAQVEGVRRAFAALAQSVGSSQDKMLDALTRGSQGMIAQRDLMKSFNLAAQLVTRDFAQRLPEAMGLLGKVSAATGEDMGFMLDSLVRGVGRLSPLILDNLGIQVDLASANEVYAKSIGKTVAQLTKQEQQTALANQALEKLRVNTAVMPDLAGTAQFEMARFGATMQNFRDEIGTAFLPVLGQFLQKINDLAQRVLPPLIEFFENRLVPALSVLTDAFGKAADSAIDAGQRFVTGFGAKLAKAAEDALRFGIKISTELATGIIQGAAAALTAAMNFIGGILQSWLGPGSPPRIAPNIDKWGAAAFTEYLKGFGTAEFDILEGLQSPLQSALSALVGAGKLGEDEAIPVFRQLSFELSKAIDGFMETGVVGTAIFDKLKKAGGQFGTELSELARKQFDLAGATREVLAAEESLNAARKLSEQAQDTVDSLADEFNRLLAAGSDPAILDAKRAEFEAAKNQLATSKEQVTEAEKRKEEAEAQVDPLKEQVRLQERLLAQLIQLADKQETLVEKTKKSAKESISAIAPAISNIGATVDTTFTDIKQKIQDKLKDIFKPVTDAWKDDIEPTLKQFGKDWEEFTDTVQAWWKKNVQPVIDDMVDLLPEGTLESIGKWIGMITVGVIAFTLLGAAIGFVTSPLALLVAAITLLAVLWGRHGEQITKTIEQLEFLLFFALNKAATAATQLWFVVKFLVIKALNDAFLVVTGLGDLISTIFNLALEALVKKWQEVKEAIDPVVEVISGKLLGFIADLQTAWEKVSTAIKTSIDNVLTPLKKALEDIKAVLDPLIQGLKDFFDAEEKVGKAHLGAMASKSPPPFQTALEGVSRAMQQVTAIDLPRFTEAMQGVGRTSQITNNFSFSVATTQGADGVRQTYQTAQNMAG